MLGVLPALREPAGRLRRGRKMVCAAQQGLPLARRQPNELARQSNRLPRQPNGFARLSNGLPRTSNGFPRQPNGFLRKPFLAVAAPPRTAAALSGRPHDLHGLPCAATHTPAVGTAGTVEWV